MTKFLVDAGTSWSKLLELYKSHKNIENSPLNNYTDHLTADNMKLKDKNNNDIYGRTFIFNSGMVSKLNLSFDAATGHMVKKMLKPDGVYLNEVIALAYGAKKLIKDLSDTTILDIGSRDIKWVKFKDGKYNDLDWNGACGSATGATTEMLCKFYNVNPSLIEISEEKYPVTCGVFAMEKIMDDIASDIKPEIAISRYIHGIAYNAWKFAGYPKQIYLSGGFCINKCFVKSLELHCKVDILGRHVLLQGLF